jgi:hypothetical protein
MVIAGVVMLVTGSSPKATASLRVTPQGGAAVAVSGVFP